MHFRTLPLLCLMFCVAAPTDVWARRHESFYESSDAYAYPQPGIQTVPGPASVDVAFSPNGGATELVVKAINSAKQTIHMASYSFTSEPIAEALANARARGIDVDVVIDHEQVSPKSHSVVPYLLAQNVPLRVDTIHKIQHDKYMVIDGHTVETGSFNYTASAEKHNSENAVVLWDAPKLAEVYDTDWHNLWSHASLYGAR